MKLNKKSKIDSIFIVPQFWCAYLDVPTVCHYSRWALMATPLPYPLNNYNPRDKGDAVLLKCFCLQSH